MSNSSSLIYAAPSTVSNERCAVFQLPNELMGKINHALSPPIFTGPKFDERSYPAFSLSHTCRQWRESILSFPKCWRWIPCTNAHWLDEGLRRSDGALLHLYIDVETLGALYLTRHRLASQTRRAQIITLGEMTDARSSQSVVSKFGGMLDLKLLLNLAYPCLEEAYLMQWSPTVLPLYMPSILDSHDPYRKATPMPLRHLVVSDAILVRVQHLFRAPLTYFEIVRGVIWAGKDDMIAFFKALPQLEVFIARDCDYLFTGGAELVGMQDEQDEPYPPHSYRVVMPALKHFTCHGPFYDGLEVMRHLSLPATCIVHLSGSEAALGHHLANMSDWEATLSALSPHLEVIPAAAMNDPSAGLSLHYRRLPGGYATEITITFTYVNELESSQVTTFAIGVCFANSFLQSTSDFTPSFVRLAPHLFANTRMLRLELTDFDTDDQVPDPDLWQAVKQTPAIEKLFLAGGAAKVLCYQGFKHDPTKTLESAFRKLCTLVLGHAEERVLELDDIPALVRREGGPPVEIVYLEGDASY